MSSEKDCLGIILAKSKSRRIKEKNFVKINNKMLFEYALGEAIKSNIFLKIHISTESKKKLEKINKLKRNSLFKSKIDASFLRSKNLAHDKTPMLKVVKKIHDKFKIKSPNIKYKYICMIYATACLIKKKDIANAFSRFKKICNNHKNKSVSMQSIVSFPVPIEHAIKINKNGQIYYINKKCKERTSDTFEKKYYDSGGFHFLNSNYFDSNNKKIYFAYEMPKSKSVDINDSEDLDLAKSLLKN